METKYKITIPEPCKEDWQAMTPEESGRFCSVCTKGVIDFTNKSEKEIQTYLQQNKGKNLCGRFRNDQLNKFDIQIPQSVFRQPMPFQKAFLLMLFIVMGSTLFSCKNHQNDSLGEVVLIEDSIKTCQTTGMILQPKDTNSKQKINPTGGEQKYNSRNIKHPKTATNETEVHITGDIALEPEVLIIEEPTRIDSIKK